MPIKAEQLPELFTFIGYNPEEIESVDAFKETFNKDFIKTSAYGARIGSLESALVKRFKAANIEFKPEEIKDKKIEEIAELGLQKTFEFTNNALELEKKKNKNPDEALTKLQGEYDTFKSEAQKKIEAETSLRLQVKNDFDKFKSDTETEKKQSAVKTYVSNAWEKFKWGTGVGDLHKKGFKATIQEKYQVNLDESGNPYTANEKGERIASTKKTGEHAGLEEILEKEGIEAKVWDVQGKGAQQTQQRTTVKLGDNNGQNGNGEGNKEVYIHPAAREAINKNPAPQPAIQ